MSVEPVPFPEPGAEDLAPPSADEVLSISRGLATAVAGPGGLTVVQRAVLNALTESMTGWSVELQGLAPLSPDELGEALRGRNRGFRTRIVQNMLLGELLLVPLSAEVTDRVEQYAARLGVSDEAMQLTRDIAHGSLGLALIDFERSGYFRTLLERPPAHLHLAAALDDAWQAACVDDALYALWAGLGASPPGSLGEGVWRFYRARGFGFPGHPQSAPPNLAQHDWVHVLAGYGSTVESEIEVFGLISRANDDPGAFALLAMVLGLFETGYVHEAARGFFSHDDGHLSRDADRMAVRLADAMYRGAKLAWHLDDDGRADETDLLGVDWFQYAEWPLVAVREHFGLPPKSERAMASGSMSAWEPGGISAFQLAAGRRLAEADGREYDSYGATPAAPSTVHQAQGAST